MNIDYNDEDIADDDSGQTDPDLDPLKESARQLPAELRDAMLKAFETGDMLQIEELIKQTSKIDEELAQELMNLADQYNYEGLAELFRVHD